MKIFKYSLIVILLVSSFVISRENGFKKTSDGVFIHISTGPENPARVLMALSLALKMVEDHDVYIFFDLEGVNVPLGTTKSLEHKNFQHSKILIDKIIANGGQIAVCQMCLSERNKTQFDIIKGVKIAAKEDFFSFTSGRIISLDY